MARVQPGQHPAIFDTRHHKTPVMEYKQQAVLHRLSRWSRPAYCIRPYACLPVKLA